MDFKTLNFLTAGLPVASEGKGYEHGFNILNQMNLDGLELEFVRGVRVSDVSKTSILNAKNLIFTAHAPFYVNLNAKEEEKIQASIERILETARVANDLNAYSITFHAAYYMGQSKEFVYQKVKEALNIICSTLQSENNNIWVRPETTGKATQWGDLEEIINMSKEFSQVLPCVDFSHLHARYEGSHNTYDEFSKILETIGNELGDFALKNFHAHLAGIAYTSKGERNHLNLQESDMNYKDLLKALKAFDVRGVLTCESPNIEIDAKLLKDFYLSL